MFTFSDTFVSKADYIVALDETEHDWTPNPDDYPPMLDLTPPHDDDSNHVIINHYRGI
jgi:hypothetical protein